MEVHAGRAVYAVCAVYAASSDRGERPPAVQCCLGIHAVLGVRAVQRRVSVYNAAWVCMMCVLCVLCSVKCQCTMLCGYSCCTCCVCCAASKCQRTMPASYTMLCEPSYCACCACCVCCACCAASSDRGGRSPAVQRCVNHRAARVLFMLCVLCMLCSVKCQRRTPASCTMPQWLPE